MPTNLFAATETPTPLPQKEHAPLGALRAERLRDSPRVDRIVVVGPLLEGAQVEGPRGRRGRSRRRGAPSWGSPRGRTRPRRSRSPPRAAAEEALHRGDDGRRRDAELLEHHLARRRARRTDRCRSRRRGRRSSARASRASRRPRPRRAAIARAAAPLAVRRVLLARTAPSTASRRRARAMPSPASVSRAASATRDLRAGRDEDRVGSPSASAST